MQIKKGTLKKFRFLAIFSGIFLLALLILSTTPVVVSLAESKISSSNLPSQKDLLVSTSIAGISKDPQLEIKDSGIIPPQFSAKAVLAMDVDLNKVLYTKNADMRLSPASTTKIMTAIVAQEYYKPADVLVVPAGAMVGGSTMGLQVGENMTFRSLLYGMLLNSGNDAAYTIAINFPGGFEGFINKMNLKTEQLGLKNTHFENPNGFDNPNHYSSASDLASIAKVAIKDPYLAKIFSTKETSVIAYDKSRSHVLKNLNQLLSENGVIGIKTGFTEKAGENFVGLVERDGHKILTVVLDSNDRFGESKNLMDWVYTNFKWEVN